MKTYIRIIKQVADYMNVIAGIALTFMMMITVIDVILRRFGMAIPGTYEIVAFTGVVVVGFSIAHTAWIRGHVFVDLVVNVLPSKTKRIVVVCTRIMGIAFFAALGYRLIGDGFHLIEIGEVSATIQFPFYPVAFGLSCCSFVMCLVLFADVHRAWEGKL